MKIMHIAQCYNDGFGYHENIMPKYQKKFGHDVVVVTSDREYKFKEFSNRKRKVERNEYMDDNIRVVRIPIKTEFEGRFVIFKNLKNVLEIEKPDYIYHHGLTHPSLFTILKHKEKNPSVFVAADNHSDLNNSARKWLWKIGYYNIFWSQSLKRYLKYIDIVFGVTPARCYFANEELGIPWDSIRLLPLGADEDMAKKVGSKFSKNECTNEKLIVITGGKIGKDKALENLLEAVSGLDLKLTVFGVLSKDLKEKIEKSVYNNVYLCGWQNREETFKLLLESDVAIWNKRHTTLVEDAIATLTPIILRYHGSTCHHIRGNGFYIYTDNPIEIRQYFEFLIKNRAIILKMRQESKKVLDLLSYNRIAKESIDYYYDRSPKLTHQVIMNDPLCHPNKKGFRRLSCY